MKRLVHDLEIRIKFMRNKKDEVDKKLKEENNEYLNLFRQDLLNEISWLICFKQKLEEITLGEQEAFIKDFERQYTSLEKEIIHRLAEIEQEDEDACASCGGEDCICCEIYHNRQK